MREGNSTSEALLSTLSDDLSLPLVQIKTSLEILDGTHLNKAQKQLVHNLGLSAQFGLKLIEAYRLALSLADTNQLPLEPVTIGAVLVDVAHELTPLASSYDTEIWVDTQSHLKPVLAHRPSLITALNCLGVSLLRAQQPSADGAKSQLLLGAHRHPGGEIVAGIYGNSNISEHALRAARALSGRARQPLSSVPAGTASGVLVADMLCARIWEPLRVARHQSLIGLATIVPSSKQLNFV